MSLRNDHMPAAFGADPMYTANHIRSFSGGSKQTLMCRNLLFENPKDGKNNLMAAVFDETSSSVIAGKMHSKILREIKVVSFCIGPTVGRV